MSKLKKEDLRARVMDVLNNNPLQNQDKLTPCDNQLKRPRMKGPWSEFPDHREKVSSRVQNQQSATCFLQGVRTWKNETRIYYGSAFAVSSRVLVTSAHNVIHDKGIALKIAVIPSLKEQQDDAEIFAVQSAHVFPDYYRSNDYNHDFAILILKEPLPSTVGKYALFPEAFDRLDTSSLVCENYSYPGDDKPLFEMWRDKRLVTKQGQTLITTNRSVAGQSGSPVSLVDHDFDYPPAIAIHTSVIGIPLKTGNIETASTMTTINMEKIFFIRDTLQACSLDNQMSEIVIY
ncbi:trypsin-like serine peptidase [Risungbinella massiliensis]|uniref:trypsin-like serine peptidase n=1 Tax=Risungbinella massiliensis TaxID=1329796 RepID=UPI0005CC355E|nr:trypsin-like serine protease [Risungbinella massiliensis]